MNKEKLDLLIKRLELEAENYEPLDEEFSAYDSSGGNFDDAFWQGYEHGSAEFACELLQFLKGE
jgi:hypothetical protein